ncbi:hypothetical protein VQL36_20370 [Chengkuizengella sp. SCS-71B]|uniref:hypothetical protein n=1 Tax=Chengkuizengella sp. SCS-71B TaxID=3115290 RepID=UPI0032C21121
MNTKGFYGNESVETNIRQINSVLIVGDYGVTLSESGHMSSSIDTRFTYTSNENSSTATTPDMGQVNSLRVYEAGVHLLSMNNFGGRYALMDTMGDYDGTWVNDHIGNNNTNSILVIGKYNATIYDNGDFTGNNKSFEFDSDPSSPNLSSEINWGVSTIRLFP